MAGSNLTPNDFIIVQREDKNYRISGDQILNFSMEQIQPQLDDIELALQVEAEVRKRGDDESKDALDAFLQRLEENVNQLFPLQDSIFYKYRIDYPSNAEFASTYLACAGQYLDEYPRIEGDAKCFSAAQGDYHQDLANCVFNDPGNFFLSSHDLTIGAIDAVYINTYKTDNASDNIGDMLDELTEGDLIQINAVDSASDGTTVVSNTVYGLFRIVKNVGVVAGDDGTNSYNQLKNLHGITLALVAGTEDVKMVPNKEFQIRFLTAIAKIIDEKYVFKSGDTMTGQLNIEVVDIDVEDTLVSNGNIDTKTITVENSITLKDASGDIINNGVINFKDSNGNTSVVLDDGTVGLLINYNLGARYASTIDLTENEQLTHKLYVDDKDNELELEIDKLSEKVDGLAQITQTTLHIFDEDTDGTYIDDTSMDDWASDIIDADGLIEKTFRTRSPGDSNNQSFATTQKILVHENYLPNNVFKWINNVRTNDILEIVHQSTENTPDSVPYHYVMYKIQPQIEGNDAVVEHVLTDNSKAYELSVVYMRSQGNSLYNDEQYKLNTYDRNTGLSIESTDERYVSLIGDTMTGQLRFDTADSNNTFVGGNVLLAKGSSNKTLFSVNATDGSVKARGGLEIGFADTSSDAKLKIPGAGSIDFGAVGLSGGPTITVGNSVKLQFASSGIAFNQNELRDIKNPQSGSTGEQSAVTRKYFTDNIKVDPDDNETLINISTVDATGRVLISGGGVNKLSNLVDTEIGDKESINDDGIVLGWNRTTDRWVPKKFGDTYGPGQNLFVYSEGECDVGGMWTDSKDKPNNPSFYIRVS